MFIVRHFEGASFGSSFRLVIQRPCECAQGALGRKASGITVLTFEGAAIKVRASITAPCCKQGVRAATGSEPMAALFLYLLACDDHRFLQRCARSKAKRIRPRLPKLVRPAGQQYSNGRLRILGCDRMIVFRELLQNIVNMQ